MKTRSLLLTACVLTAAVRVGADQPATARAPEQTPRAATPAPGQPPRAPTPSPGPATAPAPRRVGQPVNIRIDVTITDQIGSGAPALKKTISVVTGDNMNGFIRSEAFYTNIGAVPLNVDTEPEILTDGKIRLRVNLQYDLPASSPPTGETSALPGRLTKTQIRENLALILENGKPLIAAQSADPVGDRQVTIEVKATVLR